MMNFIAAAGVLDALMLELAERGVAAPAHVTASLQTARSLARIGLRKAEEDSEAELKTLAVLQDAEMNLLSLAETNFGAAYAEDWQRRMAAAGAIPVTKTPAESASKFVVGVPKGVHWMRIRQSELEKLPDADFARYYLTALPQADGYLLLYGEKTNITAFLKEMRKAYTKEG